MRTSPLVGFSASILSLLFVGCSGPADPVGAQKVAPSSAPIARAHRPTPSTELDLDANTSATASPALGEFFVWASEGEERTLTYRLDAAGRPIETIEGLVVATEAGAWRWQTDDELVPTFSCEHIEDDEGHQLADEEVALGHVTRASLEHMQSGVEQIVVAPGDEFLGTAELQHRVNVVASVGPYLFLEETTYAFTCGAHGNTSVSTSIWNVATGARVATPMDLGGLDDARDAAIRELSSEEDEHFPPTIDNVELTSLVPRFSPDGTLVVGLQFTAPTCYACTRGGSGSYTKSAVVDAPVLPSLVAPFESAPPAIRTFLRTHPDIIPGGWSAR